MEDEDAARLSQLVGELASDPAFATGKRRFPRRVTFADAATIAAGLQDEVDAGVEARSQSLVAQGMTLACQRGCNGCCEEPIMIFRPEAALVARWLLRPENAAIKDGFLAAYPAWKQGTGDTPARLSALFSGSPEPYIAAHIDGWAKRVMCAFNRDGDCTIYPVRPITCRSGHALETSEHCHGGSPRSAARANFVPLDQFIKRTRSLLQATHNAVHGPKARVEALCHVVHELITRRVALLME